MKVEEFRKILHEDITLASKAEESSEPEEFIRYATGILSDAEEFDDFIECHYEGLSRKKGNIKIDGYSFNEVDGSCNIFICYYAGENGEESIKAEEINAHFKKMRLFVEDAKKYELFAEPLGNAQASEFARDLHYDYEKITKYKFYLLTDAYNRQRAKSMKGDVVNDKPTELNVWDITRLYELVSSRIPKESVEIKLEDFGIDGIPCVKAVEYKDIVADIDVIPGKESSNDDGIPDNIVSYSSYLAVVPGRLLNDLYLEYGSKLLEGNVRSFLSARGKVNKSIQNTIKNYPCMFFAYNNGIAATATEIDTEMKSDGMRITRIKDLQIVNGGQTTASIANTMLTLKKGENADIESVFVPMKISVLNHASAERIIPKISEYSNSQNPVAASDFFSNHPFHIRMEDLSRKTPIPSINGNQFQQYWFYERARGQYNQGKMKLLTKTQLKNYSDKYPEKQVITMLDFARYMEIYNCAPDIVSKGRQKTLQVFAEQIKGAWEKSDTKFNAFYYKKMIAIAILYKKTDEIIRNSVWYKTTHSYKANVAAYALSILFYYIKTQKKDMELDFIKIWDNQNTYEELDDQIKLLCQEVYEYITGPRPTENVTEWCKKEACWTNAKGRTWTLTKDFEDTLVSKEHTEAQASEGSEKQKVVNEIDTLKEILARGPEYWGKVLEWGQTERLLTEKEVSIIKLIINMNVTGRNPSDKQMKVVVQARARLIKNGMPMQFL